MDFFFCEWSWYGPNILLIKQLKFQFIFLGASPMHEAMTNTEFFRLAFLLPKLPLIMPSVSRM